MGNRIALGLNGLAYSYAMNPFLNWWKIAATLNIARTAGGTITSDSVATLTGYIDPATGELLDPCPADVISIEKIFISAYTNVNQVGAGLDYVGEGFTAEWDGSATGLFTGAISSQTFVSANKRTMTATTGVDNLGLRLTVTDVNDPPRNVRVYQTRYAAEVAGGDRYNPHWLAQVSQFRDFRFSPGWWEINDDTSTSFSQIAPESWPIWGRGFMGKTGVHPSVICHFANEVGAENIHVSVPHRASDALMTELAEYYRDNFTIGTVTFEFSNECWNFSFNQTHDMSLRGARIWGKNITAATVGSPTTLTIPSHGFTNGETVSIYFNDAPTFDALTDNNEVVTVIDANTVTVPIDSTGLTFSGTDSWASNDDGRYSKFYGYRAAQFMKIVRDVYADTTRWRGCLATQTVNTSVTNNALTGINYFRANELSPANSLEVDDLFDEVSVTGYFGDVQQGKSISNITKASTAVVSCASHGYANGTVIKPFMGLGMTNLSNTYQTVANATTHTFELQGVDSTGFADFDSSAGSNNYAIKGTIFQIMDESTQANIDDAVTYPTKYSLFNSVLAEAFMDGSATSPDGYTVSQTSIASLQNTYWKNQKAIAAANGLELRQYEGGMHYTTDVYLSGYTFNAQFVEFMFHLGHSAEVAEVYMEGCKAFLRAGGIKPSKFVEFGQSSQFGTWGGWRFEPLVANSEATDTGNPVWQAVVEFNANPQPETYVLNFG